MNVSVLKLTKIFSLCNLYSHWFEVEYKVPYKILFRKELCLCLFYYFSGTNDLNFLKQKRVYNFKITLAVFVLSVNRKVDIFIIHG